MNARVRELILDSDYLPWGEQCSAALAEAIALADSLGEHQWAYAARMRLVQNAAVIGNQRLLLSTFAICEQLHHDDPGTFPINPADMGPAGEGYLFADLAWLWKSVIGVFERSLNFSAQMVDQAFADMEQLYRSEGLGPMATHQRRLDRALSRRDVDEARRERSILATLARDDHADCPACSTAQLVATAMLTGEKSLALSLLDGMLADGLRCTEEPASILSLALDLIATEDNARRVPGAVSEILRTPTGERVSPAPTARLAVLAARCGHHEQALSMIRSVIGRLEDNPTDHALAELLWACLAHICRAASPTLGEREIPELDTDALRASLGVPSGPLTVRRVGELAESIARDLSRRFDLRNGTDGHHRRVAEILDPHTYDLDLELALAGASPEATEYPSALLRMDDPVIPDPTTVAEAQEYADTLLRLGHEPRMVRRLAEQWSARSTTPLDHIALDLLVARALDEDGDGPGAAGIFDRLADELTELGHQDLAGALRTYPSHLNDHTDLTIWERITALLIGVDHEFGPAAAGLLVSVHEEFLHEGQWTRADRWLSVAERQLPVASWRDQATAARLRLAARRASTGADLSWLTEAPVPTDESPMTTIARHQALAAVARARNDVEAAYRHVVAATRAQAAWATAPARARQVLALVKAAAAADRTAEVAVATTHLVALSQKLPTPDRQMMVLGAVQALNSVELGDRALPLAADLVAELGEEPPTLLSVQALEALGRAQVLTLQHIRGARTLLRAADLYDELGEYSMSRISALEAANEFLRSGDPRTSGLIAERLLEAAHPMELASITMTALHVHAQSATRIPDLDPQTVITALSQALDHDFTDSDLTQRQHHQARIQLLWAEWASRRGNQSEAMTHATQGLAVCPPSTPTVGQLNRTMATILLRIDPEGNYDSAKEFMTRVVDDPDASPQIRQEAKDWLERHPAAPR